MVLRSDSLYIINYYILIIIIIIYSEDIFSQITKL